MLSSAAAPLTTTTTNKTSKAASHLLATNHSFDHDDHLETTSVCSSVSSLSYEADEEDTSSVDEFLNENEDLLTTIPMPTTQSKPVSSKRKGRFTIKKLQTTTTTQATTRPTTTSNLNNNTNSPVKSTADAVSISFLSSNSGDKEKQPVKQVIQKALTRLKPGGVFFVLDYKDDAAEVKTISTETTSPSHNNKMPKSPQSTSRCVKELPDELMGEWNLTLVPTNLETYYNTSKPSEAKPAAPRSFLPASRRIVRWMGIKPASASAAATLTVAARGPAPGH